MVRRTQRARERKEGLREREGEGSAGLSHQVYDCTPDYVCAVTERHATSPSSTSSARVLQQAGSHVARSSKDMREEKLSSVVCCTA